MSTRFFTDERTFFAPSGAPVEIDVEYDAAEETITLYGYIDPYTGEMFCEEIRKENPAISPELVTYERYF